AAEITAPAAGVFGGMFLAAGGFMAMGKASEGFSGCGDGGGPCDTEKLSWGTVGVVTGIGAALVVVSLVALGVKASTSEPAATPFVPREPTERERAESLQAAERIRTEHARAERERLQRDNREQAFALVMPAAEAARAGDCATALKVGDQIR